MKQMDQQNNQYLDRLMRMRKSTRAFRSEAPERELVEAIVEAGRLAPYAGLAQKGRTNFRHFFILPTSGETAASIRAAVSKAIQEKLEHLSKDAQPEMNTMLSVMRMISEKGLPPWTAPYLIIVAEQRGYPAREEAVLAHCMQNMWLKATALGIGFQLVSSVSDLNDGDTLCNLLGLPVGAYAYDACMIGYPAESLSDRQRSEPIPSVTWLET